MLGFSRKFIHNILSRKILISTNKNRQTNWDNLIGSGGDSLL